MTLNDRKMKIYDYLLGYFIAKMECSRAFIVAKIYIND